MTNFYRLYRIFSELKMLIRTRHFNGPAGDFERMEYMDDIKPYLKQLSPDIRNQINDFIDKEMSCLVFKENFKFDDPVRIRYVHSIYNPMDAEKLLRDTYYEELWELEYKIDDFAEKMIEIEIGNAALYCQKTDLPKKEEI